MFSSNDVGEFILVKGDRETAAHAISDGSRLPLTGGLAGAVGLSRGGFLVDLLYQHLRPGWKWEEDEYLRWGLNGEYFTCRRTDLNEKVTVLLPKGLL